jgi:nucleoid DNA-binding protein
MQRLITKAKIQELAKKYNIPSNRVEEIVLSQFELVADTMRSADRMTSEYGSVQLIGLGKFFVSERRLPYLKQINETKKEWYKKNILKEDDSIGQQVLRETDTVSGESEDVTRSAIQAESASPATN